MISAEDKRVNSTSGKGRGILPGPLKLSEVVLMSFI